MYDVRTQYRQTGARLKCFNDNLVDYVINRSILYTISIVCHLALIYVLFLEDLYT